MAGEDLGGLIPGGGSEAGGAPASAGGTWAGLVSDPVSRAAMISFGLQLMAGSHGNALQQVGVAGGHAAEAAGKTAGALQEESRNQRDFAAHQEEGNLNRASHEKIANIGADSRLAVAQERVAGMLERSRQIHGPQGPKEMDLFFKAKNSYMHDEANREILSKLTRQQQEEYASAYAKTTLQQAREATGVRSQGAPLESGSTSGVGSDVQGAPGTTTPGQNPAPGTQGGPKPDLNTLLKGARGAEIRKLLETPEGQADLERRNKDLGPQIKWYLDLQKTYGKMP